MRTKLTALMACLLTMAFLAGCKGGGSDSAGLFDFNFGGSSGGDEIVVSSLPSSGSSDTSTDSGSGGSDVSHQPEPATLALLGSGLLAYAILRRKKRR